MGWSLKEADFIPSEEWLGEYLGKQGLRYRMDKTEEEIAKEGEFVDMTVAVPLLLSSHHARKCLPVSPPTQYPRLSALIQH